MKSLTQNQYPSKSSRRLVAAGLVLAGAVAPLTGAAAPRPSVAPKAPTPTEASAVVQGGNTQESRTGAESRVAEIINASIAGLAGNILAAAENNPRATREAIDGGTDITLASTKGPRACIVTLALGADGKPQVISYSSVEQSGGRTKTLGGMLAGSNTAGGASGNAGGAESDARTGGGMGGAVSTWDASDGNPPEVNAGLVVTAVEQTLPEVLACAAG